MSISAFTELAVALQNLKAKGFTANFGCSITHSWRWGAGASILLMFLRSWGTEVLKE